MNRAPLLTTPARPGLSLLAGLLLAAAVPAHAIVSTSSASNWLSSALANPDSLDGVAKLVINGSTGCSGTLLAGGAFVLTAAHCVTDASGALTATSIALSLASGTVSAKVSSASQIDVFTSWNGSLGNNNDLALLQLDSAVTGISGYQLYTANPLHQTVLIAGYGLTGVGSSGATASTFGTLHWGNNVYDTTSGTRGSGSYLFDFDDGLAANSSMGNLGLGSAEAMIASGDSGGASFITLAGQLYLAGVHSFGQRSASFDIDGTANSSYGEAGGDTVLYSAATQAWITQATSVPEPATLAQLLAGLLLLPVLGRGRRR
jgi:hypothetical protein